MEVTEGLLWSRSCEIAARVYRLLAKLPDRGFADRILCTTLNIPERVAARIAAAGRGEPGLHGPAIVESLTVLPTQLYLASECGLVARDESYRLCFEAARLAERFAETQSVRLPR